MWLHCTPNGTTEGGGMLIIVIIMIIIIICFMIFIIIIVIIIVIMIMIIIIIITIIFIIIITVHLGTIQIEWWKGEEAVQTDHQNIEVTIDQNKYDTNLIRISVMSIQ